GVASWAEGKGYGAQDFVPWIMILTGAVFALAAIPSFLFLRERSAPTGRAAAGVLARLKLAWRDTRENFVDFRMLLICGACYQAGIAVVITLSAVYATQVMGFGMTQTMLLVFTVNIGAAAGAFLFGYVQDRIGHKRALMATLFGWLVMVGL